MRSKQFQSFKALLQCQFPDYDSCMWLHNRMPPFVRNTSKYLEVKHLVSNLFLTGLGIRMLFVLFLLFHLSLELFTIKINLKNK